MVQIMVELKTLNYRVIGRDDESVLFNKLILRGNYLEWDPNLDSIADMDPDQFRAAYKGRYADCFKHIRRNHNRFMGIKTVNKLIKIMNKMNYYGVIYKFTQIRDLLGNDLKGFSPSIVASGKELKQGLNRVGKSKEIKYRIRKYFRSINKPMNNFELALASFRSNIKEIKKSFKIKILSVCKSKKEYDATEIFWTLYLNRKNNVNGYDLAQNKFFNPIVGDLKDYQTVDYYIGGTLFKHKVIRDLLNGYQLKSLTMKYGIFRMKGIDRHAIVRRLDKYFSETNIFAIKASLINPYLDYCLRNGFSKEEAVDYLIKSGFGMFDIEVVREHNLLFDLKPPSAIKMKYRLLNKFLEYLYGDYLVDKPRSFTNYGFYKKIQEDLYIIPFVEMLRESGVMNIAEIFIFQPSSQPRGFNGKFISYTNSLPSEFTIIEHLIVKDVLPSRIAVLIDLCSDQDSTDVKIKAAEQINTYLRNRWSFAMDSSGYTYTMRAFEEFLKSHVI